MSTNKQEQPPKELNALGSEEQLKLVDQVTDAFLDSLLEKGIELGQRLYEECEPLYRPSARALNLKLQ